MPVLILDPTVHESLARSALGRRELRLAVGIGEYAPTGSDHSWNAARIAYGARGSPCVFVIDAAGLVQHVQKGFAGLEAKLGALAEARPGR